jgi:hypothetical protein
MRTEKPKLEVKHTRRDFLLKGASFFAKFAVANAGLYVVGSAFKSLDGSLVAGAKQQQCYYTIAVDNYPWGCGTAKIGPYPDSSCGGYINTYEGVCSHLNGSCECE